jgi:putative ABC transport system permease protein
MKFRSLIFANLFRKKIRLILTIGSFAIALVLFTFLAVVNSAFHRGIDIAGADRLVIVSRVGLMQVMPVSYGDQVRAIPGVKYVTHDHWFGGVYQDERNFFPQFVIDPENHRKVYPEFIVPDDQWNAFVKDQQGAIAGAKTAKRFGWKVGDRIPIKNTLYGPTKTWEFNLDGIYRTEKPDGDEGQFWLQWKNFDENIPDSIKDRMKSTAGWYILKLDSPDDSVRVAKAIDTKFANSSYETKTETESAFAAGFAKQFGNIEFLILSVGSVVFFTLLLVTGNTMAISVRERTAELAVLKAIGVTDRSILFLVLAESMMIALFGGVLGLLLAWAAIPVISAAVTGLLPPLLLSKTMLSFGLVFAVFVGVVSGLLPGIGAMRMRVVNALRRV